MCALDIDEDLRAAESEKWKWYSRRNRGKHTAFLYNIQAKETLSLFFFPSLLENTKHFKLIIGMFQLKTETQIY